MFFRIQDFESPGFSEPRLFRVQVSRCPGFFWSRFLRVQGPVFFGSRFFRVRVQVLINAVEMNFKVFMEANICEPIIILMPIMC